MKKHKYAADVASWLAKAKDDRGWAQSTIKSGFYPQTCFVAQQIVEKALKAFLLSVERVPEKTHSLPRLLKISVSFDGSFENFKSDVEILDKYYAPTRYPDIELAGGFTREKAEEALNLAIKILEFVEERLRSSK